MAKPTKSKDPKPKAEEAEQDKETATESNAGQGNFMQLMIIAVVIILVTNLGTAASIYFLAPMVLKPLLTQAAPAEGAEGEAAGAEGGEGEHAAPADGEHAAEGGGEEGELPKVGPVVDLEEFTVNLSDPGGERYCRADLSLNVTAEDPKFEELKGEELHKWEEGFHAEMGHYVPSIRDIVISALTARSSKDLSTEAGKKALKDEIKTKVDAAFHGGHRVISVNLENFIIQ